METGNMDWAGLAINVFALFAGFAVYLVIFNNKKLAEKLNDYQYPVLLLIVVLACLLGGILRFIFKV